MPLTTNHQTIQQQLHTHFKQLYPQHADQCLNRLNMITGRYGIGDPENKPTTTTQQPLWNQKDAILITYGDTIQSPNTPPLQTLRRFAARHLMGAFSTIHILPFHPYSSDDGFSVINYRQINPKLGDWNDINALKQHFHLMFDLVLNHTSAKSPWLKHYRNHIQPYRNYFIEQNPQTDLSKTTRPRTTPLLTQITTKTGPRHLWTTFSPDQIDLNWQNPDVFFDFLDIILNYIAHGARILRLDAIAYLHKKIGTTSIHLPQTHQTIQLLRLILQQIAPNTLLLTETNVPHKENITYFGKGDQAHLIYQFTLPPLLLHALHQNTAQHLTQWAQQLPKPPPQCAFLNFTASHDGIGIRPLEGILTKKQIQQLTQTLQQRGALLSHRTQPDGTKTTYEINTTYYTALKTLPTQPPQHHQTRFLTSQLIPLALQGIPATYIHSLTATPNDTQAAQKTHNNRRINRSQWDETHLEQQLKNPKTPQNQTLFTLLPILRRRARSQTFHPDAPQQIHQLHPNLFALTRTAPNNKHQTLCIHNLTPNPTTTKLPPHIPKNTQTHNLITDTPQPLPNHHTLQLKPYQTTWLTYKT